MTGLVILRVVNPLVLISIILIVVVSKIVGGGADVLVEGRSIVLVLVVVIVLVRWSLHKEGASQTRLKHVSSEFENVADGLQNAAQNAVLARIVWLLVLSAARLTHRGLQDFVGPQEMRLDLSDLKGSFSNIVRYESIQDQIFQNRNSIPICN